jgi:hypothetical protein
VVRQGRRHGPSINVQNNTGSLFSSQPGGPPCWASSLAFALIEPEDQVGARFPCQKVNRTLHHIRTVCIVYRYKTSFRVKTMHEPRIKTTVESVNRHFGEHRGESRLEIEHRQPIGCRPLPAVHDFTRDGRRSTWDVSVRKKMRGICAETGYQATISNKSRPAGSFSSS